VDNFFVTVVGGIQPSYEPWEGFCLGTDKDRDNTNMARPDKWTPRRLTADELKEVREAFAAYIAATPYPMAAAFVSRDPVALKYQVTKQNMSNWREMEELTKLAHAKGEAYLVEKGMTNAIDKTMSIFLLKQSQFGYRDRSEQDITRGGERIVFHNYVPRPRYGKEKPSTT